VTQAEAGRGRRRQAALAAGAVGVALGLLAGIDGPAALLPGLLAQPALALAVSWWTGTRALPADARATARDAGGVLLPWALGLLLATVLLAWPLQVLRQSGSLGAALGLSAMGAAVLLALWRTWPLWQAQERDGGTLAAAWRRLAQQETGS